MKIKFILPALTEAESPFWRPIKYSLFPPLGLAQLAAHFDPDDEITLQDEHVETLKLDDAPEELEQLGAEARIVRLLEIDGDQVIG